MGFAADAAEEAHAPIQTWVSSSSRKVGKGLCPTAQARGHPGSGSEAQAPSLGKVKTEGPA